jgi:hypothetical protein
MVYTPSPELRQCCIAAMAGDHEAARQVLKIYGYLEIAREVQPGKPFSHRVRRCVGAITAGINSEWEIVNPNGSIENLLMQPPPERSVKVRASAFDD